MRSNRRRTGFLALCVAPATVLFFLFMIVPTINVFRMSLFQRGAYSPEETFVGFSNFTALVKDTSFIRSMQNTILLVVVVTIITFALALYDMPPEAQLYVVVHEFCHFLVQDHSPAFWAEVEKRLPDWKARRLLREG